MFFKVFLLIIVCYLLGSIPSGYVIGKLIKGIDIRQYGSKNMGATNALRVLGTKLGIVTLLFDILKGFAAIRIMQITFPEHDLIFIAGGLTVIIGHIFTIFLHFKGGKGVATSAGVFVGLIPFSFGIALLVFLLTVVISKYVSLGSLSAAITLFAVQLIISLNNAFQNYEYLLFVTVICIFIFIKHKANIKRIIAGNENKISFKK